MAQFEGLVLVVRNLSHRAVFAGVISGDLLLDTPETLRALQACDSDSNNTNLVVLHPLHEKFRGAFLVECMWKDRIGRKQILCTFKADHMR